MVIRVFEGRDGKIVGRNSEGKIIFSDGEIKIGYARIKRVVQEYKKAIVAELENIVSDFYPEIDIKELKEVLDKFGYTIGFERTFGDGETHLFAYHKLEMKMAVVDTYDNGTGINNFIITVPGGDVYNLPYKSYGARPIKYIHERQRAKKDKLFRSQDIPDLRSFFDIEDGMYQWEAYKYLDGINEEFYEMLADPEHIKAATHTALEPAQKEDEDVCPSE